MNHNNINQSILWYLCFCLCFNGMDLCLKALAVFSIPLTMTLGARALIGTVFFIPRNPIQTLYIPLRDWCLIAIRVLTSFAALLIWLIPLQKAHLTSATAVTLLSPILASLLSCFIFKEPMSKDKIVSYLVSFLGTIMIIAPWEQNFNPNILFSLLTALAWSINIIASKIISERHPATTVMYNSNLLLLLLCLLWTPTWPALNSSTMLAMACPLIAFTLLGNLRQWAILQATAHTALTQLLPLEYSRLIFAALIGRLLFHEPITLSVIAGGGCIVLGNIISHYAALGIFFTRDRKLSFQA